MKKILHVINTNSIKLSILLNSFIKHVINYMLSVDEIECHILQHPIKNIKCFTLCPTMDLVSFPLDERVVLIYRRGNEKVWDVEPTASVQESTRDLQSLVWKPDGKMFVTISEGGELALFDTSTGNQLRELHLSSQVKYLKWFCTTIPFSSQGKLDSISKGLDITNFLPFSTQDISISGDVNPNIGIDQMLDFILVVSDIQKLCCIFSGIFVVDNIEIFTDGSDILEIIQSPNNSHFYCLSQKDNETYISTLCSPMSKKDTNFTEILIVCSKLISIVSHFDSSMKQINNHYKPYIDYTVRIIELLRGEMKDDLKADNMNKEANVNNVYDENEEIEASQMNADPIYDLYDLLLTGSLSSSTKTWLTDYVSDRGMKRWTKLGRAYFDNAKSITFNDIVTSLHHLIVLLTDLNGLNALDSNVLYKKYVDNCIEVATNYLKYAYKYMLKLNESQKSFEQTIVWLSSILNEITNDEKINSNIMVNEIIKYLTSLSERLNSTTENKEEFSLQEHTESLSKSFEELLVRIKSDIRNRFKVKKPVKIKTPKLVRGRYELKINKMSTVTILDKSSTKISLYQINPISMIQKSFEEPHDSGIIDFLLLNETKLLTLYPDRIELRQINWNSQKTQIMNTVLLKNFVESDDTDFNALHIQSNADSTTFCVIDSDMKKYIWVKLPESQISFDISS